jgi:hypothetical protein
VGAGGAEIVVGLPLAAVLVYKIYDLRGELIWDKVQAYPSGGSFQLHWPAQNNSGAAVSYGAYYLSVKAKFSSGDQGDGRWISVMR